MIYYIIAISMVFGIVVGCALARYLSPKVVGNLKAIYDDGQSYLYLELNRDVDLILDKKYVTLKVNLSQK